MKLVPWCSQMYAVDKKTVCTRLLPEGNGGRWALQIAQGPAAGPAPCLQDPGAGPGHQVIDLADLFDRSLHETPAQDQDQPVRRVRPLAARCTAQVCSTRVCRASSLWTHPQVSGRIVQVGCGCDLTGVRGALLLGCAAGRPIHVGLRRSLCVIALHIPAHT